MCVSNTALLNEQSYTLDAMLLTGCALISLTADPCPASTATTFLSAHDMIFISALNPPTAITGAALASVAQHIA
jgi:hypothetical protein